MASSSKRKAGMSGGGPSTKKFTGSLSQSLATMSGTQDQLNGYPRQKGKSNNRREWMKECLKLLEAMIELPDAKPFREPVDCLKYPDFYAQVEDPIDFSKVMLKFRGGQYQDPFDFQKDVRQLFTDYKGFFKDPNSEVYAQTHRLSFWFDSEFSRILDKYGDKLKKRQDSMSPLAQTTDPASRTSPKQNTNIMVSIQNGSCTILQSPERSSVPALLTDHMVPVHPHPWHHQSIGTKNYQVVQQIMTPLSSSSISPNNTLHPPFSHALAGHNKDLYPHGLPVGPPGDPNSPWLDPHLREMREKFSERPSFGAADKRASFSASRVHNTSFEMMNGGELQVAVPPNLYTRSLDRDPRLATQEEHLSRQFPGLQHHKSASLDVGYHSPAHSTGAGSHGHPSPQQEYDRASHHSAASHSPRRTPTPTHPHTPPTVRVTSPTPVPTEQSPKKQQPIPMVTERTPSEESAASVATLVGMKLDVSNVWLGSVRGKTTRPIILHEHGLKIPFYYRDTETNLHIKVDEIVRCLGHLGKNKKHTILIFVTPTCVQRIERRVHVPNTGGSLIALFLSALSTANISRLLHTFHNMGKHSMFGASLFSEVDQRGILQMLANIKPDINEKLKNSKLSSCGSSTGSNRSTSSTASAKDSGVRTVATLSVPDLDNLKRSRSLPESRDPPSAASGAHPDQGALDLSVSRTVGGLFHSGSMDHPAPPGGTLSKSGTAKAYKPKFHFRSNSHLVRQHSTTIEPQNFDSGMGSSSEDSSAAPRTPLRKAGSADSSNDSNESITGSDVMKKEDLDPESDLDLDYDEEESLAKSSHSVLLVVDSNDEELATIDPDEEEDMDFDNQVHSYRREMLEQQRLNEGRYQEQSRAMVPFTARPQLVRNPHCGHAYEKHDLLQLIDRDIKARCPVTGCANDKPLRVEEMLYGYEMRKSYDHDAIAR